MDERSRPDSEETPDVVAHTAVENEEDDPLIILCLSYDWTS